MPVDNFLDTAFPVKSLAGPCCAERLPLQRSVP